MIRVFVGKNATILKGKCAGITGLVVGANSVTRKVELEIESGNYFTTNFDNIDQPEERSKCPHCNGPAPCLTCACD